MLRLPDRGRLTGTLIVRLIIARLRRAFFRQRRTVRAGSLRVLIRVGAMVGGWLGSYLLIGRVPAGRRMIRVEAVESLAQLVEQFDRLPRTTFAKGLVYAG